MKLRNKYDFKYDIVDIFINNSNICVGSYDAKENDLYIEGKFYKNIYAYKKAIYLIKNLHNKKE